MRMTHSTKTCGPSISPKLPVPYKDLLALGLSHEQIFEASIREPLTVAFQADEQPGAYFDVERAAKALRAIGAFKHTKGRWAGVPMRIGQGLDSWQIVWILAPIFGWVYYDEEVDRVVRVIRNVWIEIPRKNGKSTLTSAISGVLLLADGEMGAEVYNAAGDMRQAGRVFDDAKRMLMTSKAAAKRIEPLTSVVKVPRTGSILRVLSSNGDGAHGLNVSGATIDEVHTLRNKGALVEAIETGVGSRDQPLIIFITTADENEQGTIYDSKHNLTKNIANHVAEDPGHYGVIWAAAETDDPFAESTWEKASPGYGKSPTKSYMRREATKAKNDPTYFPSFLRLALNRRMREQSRWIDLDHWDKLAMPFDREALKGKRAWGGLDLAATSDFSAWTVLVESDDPDAELQTFTRFWLPEDAVPELQRKLMVPLDKWIEAGFITTTEGLVVNYEAIQEDIITDSKHFDMQRIGYDRMFAGQMVQNLDKELKGVETAAISQTYFGLGAAAKEFERLLGADLLRNDGNLVMRWMASVVEVTNDGSDNVKPAKPDRKKSTTRIDGIAAALNASDGYLRRVNKPAFTTVYVGGQNRR